MAEEDNAHPPADQVTVALRLARTFVCFACRS